MGQGKASCTCTDVHTCTYSNPVTYPVTCTYSNPFTNPFAFTFT